MGGAIALEETPSCRYQIDSLLLRNVNKAP